MPRRRLYNYNPAQTDPVYVCLYIRPLYQIRPWEFIVVPIRRMSRQPSFIRPYAHPMLNGERQTMFNIVIEDWAGDRFYVEQVRVFGRMPRGEFLNVPK